MTFSEISGKVPGAKVPLIFLFETVNTEKFGHEVTIHCPSSSSNLLGKIDFLQFFLLDLGAYTNKLMITLHPMPFSGFLSMFCVKRC